MKNITFLAFIILCSQSAFSQDYRAFRVGVGAGLAVPPGSGVKGGVVFCIEPSYRISSVIAVGLRLEAAVVERGKGVDAVGGDVFKNNLHGLSSASLNGQYYFYNGTFRPFVGAGFGVFILGAARQYYNTTNGQNVNTSSDVISGGQKFGFYPRIGFDANHFTFAIEYNVVPGHSTTTYTSTTYNNGVADYYSTTNTIKNGYLSIKIGFFIGGGRM